MEIERKKIIIGLLVFAFVGLCILFSGQALIFLKGNSPSEISLKNAEDRQNGSEKRVDENLDADSDEIPDRIEKVLDTNIEKNDTDGDGYLDLEEVKNGYSPLIAAPGGKLNPEEFIALGKKIKLADPVFFEKIFVSEENFTAFASSVRITPIPAISSAALLKLSGPAVFKEEVSLSNKNWKYSFYAPADLDLNKEQTLLIGLHGFEDRAEDYIRYWQSDADKNKFIVVVLQAYPKTYPGGTTLESFPWLETGDFTKAVLANVEKKYKIDENKIFLTGYSEGASASYIIALDSGIKFMGVIPINGYLPLEAGIVDKLSKAKGVNFYVVHGPNNKDTRAIVNQETILMQYGAKMEFKNLSDLGAGYPQAEHENILKWMAGLM